MQRGMGPEPPDGGQAPSNLPSDAALEDTRVGRARRSARPDGRPSLAVWMPLSSLSAAGCPPRSRTSHIVYMSGLCYACMRALRARHRMLGSASTGGVRAVANDSRLTVAHAAAPRRSAWTICARMTSRSHASAWVSGRRAPRQNSRAVYAASWRQLRPGTAHPWEHRHTLYIPACSKPTDDVLLSEPQGSQRWSVGPALHKHALHS